MKTVRFLRSVQRRMSRCHFLAQTQNLAVGHRIGAAVTTGDSDHDPRTRMDASARRTVGPPPHRLRPSEGRGRSLAYGHGQNIWLPNLTVSMSVVPFTSMSLQALAWPRLSHFTVISPLARVQVRGRVPPHMNGTSTDYFLKLICIKN